MSVRKFSRWVHRCIKDQQPPETSTLSEEEGHRLQLAWDEIVRIVQDFSSEEPEDIHHERFQATPYGLFSEMFRAMLARTGADAAAEDWRRSTLERAARKKQEGEANLDSEDEKEAAPAAAAGDAPNPDGFGPVCRRLPKGHAVATAHAEAVLLDRTRALLDLHYDAVFLAAWEAKAACELPQEEGAADANEDPGTRQVPRRRGAHRVDRKVLEARLAQRYQTFSLPGNFTSVFQKPADETDWSKLELLRQIVVDAADGVVETCVVEVEELQILQDSVSQGLEPVLTSSILLGGTFLPAGCRLLTGLAHAALPLTVRLQLVEWMPVPLDAFGQALRAGAQGARALTVRALAGRWREPGEKVAQELSAQAAFTKLLLDLGQVLWQGQCHAWSLAGKSWVDEAKILGAVRYYLKGQHVGEKPIFDSICAYCGALLYGTLGDGIGNKKCERPLDIDGMKCAADGQPPFLLRWPPSFFAAELPDVFAWDKASNKLSVRACHRERPPWRRGAHHLHADEEKNWLYCESCHAREFFSGTDEGVPFVPFRDSVSLRTTRGLRPQTLAGEVPAVAAPSGATPEMRRRWAHDKKRAARANPQRGTKLNFANVVPKPQGEYWQSAPEAPFADLKTEDARGRLSVCNLISSMKKHQDEKGRAAYASSAAETVFFRRQPEQLATTLAFMLGHNEGQVFRIRESEVKPLRECLLWLREHNPHIKQYLTNFEKFKDGNALTKLRIGNLRWPT